MIEEVAYIALLLLGILNGFILAWFCKDELKKWKKRFLLISILSVLATGLVTFIALDEKTPIKIALLFTALTFLTLYFKAEGK
jgi:hypothetical protein